MLTGQRPAFFVPTIPHGTARFSIAAQILGHGFGGADARSRDPGHPMTWSESGAFAPQVQLSQGRSAPGSTM
jgi:hypothetical protein